MSVFLKRDLAPITGAAWSEIDSEATRILKGNLSARAIVDLRGPLGWDCAAIGLGRVDVCEPHGQEGVNWGVRKAQPLVELRVPFQLSQWELDNIERGAADVDLKPVTDAAFKAASFEEQLVYAGLAKAGIEGMVKASSHPPVKIRKNAADAVEAVESAVLALQYEGIGGPYELVAGSHLYAALSTADSNGNALLPRVKGLLEGGGLRWSPSPDCGLILSRRGGDYELTLGQDFSVGYQYTQGDTLHLYLTETLTFRVLEPAAAVALAFKA